MADFATVALSVAMVVGPIVGYIDQYFIIRRKRSSAGFSAMTCGVLLVANILRIFFWLGKRFDTTLLAQSIVMILAQLALLEIVVRYRPDPSPLTLYSQVRASFSSDSLGDEEEQEPPQPRTRRLFKCWSWSHYLDYINFLLGFTTVVALLYLFLGQSPAFIEVLGFLSLGIESTLPVPQCVFNFKRRSTAGFSLLVLASWVFGDSFKLFYFLYTHSPLQFLVCGAIQLSVDTLIVLQCIVFSDAVKKRLGVEQVPALEDDL